MGGSAHSPPLRRPHLLPLTSIRFVAAFHVVIYHNSRFLDPLVPDSLGFIRNIFHTGYSGVNLFFVLSGFILAYVYLDPDREARVDERRFWVARFARIYPVYLLSLLVVSPIVIGHFFTQDPPALATAKVGTSLASALTLTQAWVPPFRNIWNAPGWTLSAEAFFYALFPFIVGPIWRLGRARALQLGAAVWALGQLPALLAISGFPPEVGRVAATESIPANALAVLVRSAPLMRLHEFVFGIALARAFYPVLDPTPAQGRRGQALALAGMVALAVALAFADHIPRFLVHSGALAPLYAVVLVGLASARGPLVRLLSIRPLVVLGEASYGIYILHIPIRIWMLRWIGPDQADRMGIGFFALYSAVVIGASVAAFWYLEDPARRWIRRRLVTRPLGTERA